MPLEKNETRWAQTPLLDEHDAQKAGILRNIICVPDSRGIHHPFKEEVELVSRSKSDMENLGPIDYASIPVECPRFRKCDSCPQALGNTAIVTQLG